jgi:hypothetical protein
MARPLLPILARSLPQFDNALRSMVSHASAHPYALRQPNVLGPHYGESTCTLFNVVEFGALLTFALRGVDLSTLVPGAYHGVSKELMAESLFGTESRLRSKNLIYEFFDEELKGRMDFIAEKLYTKRTWSKEETVQRMACVKQWLLHEI